MFGKFNVYFGMFSLKDLLKPTRMYLTNLQTTCICTKISVTVMDMKMYSECGAGVKIISAVSAY